VEAVARYILHALSSRAVSEFLSQWLNKSCSFISDSINHFLAGDDHPQTNQPNSQAGSKP